MPRDPTSQAKAAQVLAVVVCFQPQVPTVVAIVRNLLATRLADVLLVDNTERPETCAELHAAVSGLNVDVVCHGTNLGVAEAHNIGIRHARERGHRAVLLLDQDTQLEDGTLARLLAAMDALQARGEHVAAVGAAFVDPRNGFRFPFVRLTGLRMRPVPLKDAEPVECDLLISSGCLISVVAAEGVGEMESRLFIDYVDIEWCLRARAAGLKVFGVADARMQHTIGDASLRIFGRNIPVHTPARQYYLIRNALLLARKPYLSLRWRLHLIYRVAAQIALFGLFCPPRLTRLRSMLRGLVDGILDRGSRIAAAPEPRHEPRASRTAADDGALGRVEGRSPVADLPTSG